MIIGIAGKKGSGKDTLADGLLTYLSMGLSRRPIKRGFADGVKDIAMRLFDLPYSVCYGSMEEKERPRVNGHSARHILQLIGTEWGRSVDPDVWVKKAMRECRQDDVTIFIDVRFPNECDAIRAAGGWNIRLLRSLYADSHASETALDDYGKFDLVIEDCSAQETLKQAIAFLRPKFTGRESA